MNEVSGEWNHGMNEHTWTTGDGVDHVAYQCVECGRWFDSPSLHYPLAEECVRDAGLDLALVTPVDEGSTPVSVDAVRDVMRSHTKRRPIPEGSSKCIMRGWQCACGVETEDHDRHVAERLVEALSPTA